MLLGEAGQKGIWVGRGDLEVSRQGGGGGTGVWIGTGSEGEIDGTIGTWQ